jgi:threonine dehydratase
MPGDERAGRAAAAWLRGHTRGRDGGIWQKLAAGVASRGPGRYLFSAVEWQLDELYRVEEALVAAAIEAGQPVHRLSSAPPAAVLGVRVADKVSRAA